MRLTICLTAAAAIVCAGSTPAVAKSTKHAAFQLDGTSWTFTDKKEGKIRESIDADGNYISQTVGGKHLDHGTAVMKGNKACFTSKMNKDGEMCWTTTPVSVGHSFVATNDKGDKLRVSRVAYTKLSMPK
jgi:hypothetical protein